MIWHYVFKRDLEVRSAPALHWLCENDRSARHSKEKSQIEKKVIWHYVFRREVGVWSAPALHWLCDSDTRARPSKEKSPESGFTHFCNCFLMVFWGARCPPELQQQKDHSWEVTVSFVNMCKSWRNVNGTAARTGVRGPGGATIIFY